MVTIRPFTDLGNAEMLVDLFGDKMLYCPQKRQWLVWNGRKWIWDESGLVNDFARQTIRSLQLFETDDVEFLKAVKKWGKSSESKSRMDSMIGVARNFPEFNVFPYELDVDPHFVNFENGILNLDTGLLMPHDKKYLITKSTGFEYKHQAHSEEWNDFIVGMVPDDETREYLQKTFGYCLYGKATEKSFWFFYGPADCGKSTFLELILNVFGDYGASSQFTTWIYKQNRGDNRGDIVDLMGTRFVVASEIRKGSAFDEELIKRATGGDRLKFSKKFTDEIEFYATFGLFFAANDPPTIRDDDSGTWSRVKRIHFPNPVKNIDKNIKEKLSTIANRQAIMSWMVDGYRKWKMDGLSDCAAVKSSNEAYKKEMDRTVGFFDECLEFGHGYETNNSLWASYDEYCQEEGIKGVTKKGLFLRLKNAGCEPYRDAKGRGWQGVSIKRGVF